VLGVDRWKGAWVGVVLEDRPGAGHDLAGTVGTPGTAGAGTVGATGFGDPTTAVTGVVGRTITDVVLAARRTGGVDVVAIDIPIGVPARGSRQADVLARRVVGPRRSSVFPTPVRAALEARDYAAAVMASRDLTGVGLSRQAHALGPALLEVEEWVRSTAVAVVEVHPEVSFAVLAGSPLPWSKKSWAGARARLDLLAGAGVHLPADLGPAAVVPVDDVLDAAVAAWSARRYLRGEAVSFPDPPEVLDGIGAAIWA
jgi:predicted RNase H-like nuclease